MYQRILVCTDGSELALHAAAAGVELARVTGAVLVAVHASPAFEAPMGFEFVPLPLVSVEDYVASTKAAAGRYLLAVRELSERAGVECRTRHLRSLTPAQAIIAVAAKEKCDLIVMGSHGHGALGQLVLGSVTTQVLAACNVPVLVHRDRPRKRGRR
jgi:nucleotide-binding universal stress UspA family protein